MSQENLKDIEFNEHIQRNIGLFNEVLEKCGELPLLENENFTTFLDFQTNSNSLVLEYLQKKENTISITIWFEYDYLRIDIDEIPETFEWAKEHIDKDEGKVVEFIENLFTGYILIDYRGKSARFVQMFDKNGHFFISFSRNVLLHLFSHYLLRQNDYRRLYLPAFKKIK